MTGLAGSTDTDHRPHQLRLRQLHDHLLLDPVMQIALQLATHFNLGASGCGVSALSVDQSGLVGEYDELDAAGESQLRQDPVDVGLDRGCGEHQDSGDRGIGQPLGDEQQDFAFAGRERIQAAFRVQVAWVRIRCRTWFGRFT